MEIIRTSSFWRDLKGLVDYFDDAYAEARAVRFIDAVDDTIDFIEEFPDLGHPWQSKRSRREGLRVRLVMGFENYIVLYRRDNDTVYIMRVVDARRSLEELLQLPGVATVDGAGDHEFARDDDAKLGEPSRVSGRLNRKEQK